MPDKKQYTGKEIIDILNLVFNIKGKERVLKSEIRMDGGLHPSVAKEYLKMTQEYESKVSENIRKNIEGRVIDSVLKSQCEYYAELREF